MRIDFNTVKQTSFASQLKLEDFPVMGKNAFKRNVIDIEGNRNVLREDFEAYYTDKELDIFEKQLEVVQEAIKDDGDPEFWVWMIPDLANDIGVVGAHRGIHIYGDPDQILIPAHPVRGFAKRLMKAYNKLRSEL